MNFKLKNLIKEILKENKLTKYKLPDIYIPKDSETFKELEKLGAKQLPIPGTKSKWNWYFPDYESMMKGKYLIDKYRKLSSNIVTNDTIKKQFKKPAQGTL